MNPFDSLAAAVDASLDRLVAAGRLPPGLDRSRVMVEPPRDPTHGDAATNAALVLAKPAGDRPLNIAASLAEELARLPEFAQVEAAAPGFVNFRLVPDFWRRQIPLVLRSGADYGRSSQGADAPVNVEYCSANPTGPLHVGHGRGTVFGDALANLLEFAGWRPTREYYVNDGGAQIEALARSIHHRYLEALGRSPGPMPEGLYPLEQLTPVAEAIAERDGSRWADADDDEWLDAFGREAVAAMLALIKDDLAAVGVHHDVFSSERALLESGRVEDALARLDDLGLLYEGTLPPPKGKPVEDWEPVPQLLFRATRFGDDSDRPLKRSSGAWTYFAADVAYHLDKYRRGFNDMIDVLGADHGGYVKRMQAAVRAVSEGEAVLDCPLCQLVNLTEDGKPVRMSKRAGRIVTMRDVVDEVGKDVFRFIMLTRKNDAPLDFDLAKVVEQSKDNPVFYVQYAHARICSVFRNAQGAGFATAPEALAAAALSRLGHDSELALIREVASFPRMIAAAASAHEPHRVTFYLNGLAGAFHALWTQGKDDPTLRFLVEDDAASTGARLALLAAVRTTIANGLAILGVTPVSEMH